MDIQGLAERFGENHNLVVAALEKSAAKASALEAKAASVEQSVAGISGEIASLHQRIATRGVGGTPVGQKSWGEQFVESDGLREFNADTSRPRRYRLDVKTTITTGSTSGGALAPADRDMVNTMPKRRLTVRSLLNVISVSGNSVEYPRQTGRPSAAAPVAEGSAKPESAMAFELVQTPLRVIAHWIPASRQVLDDSPQLKDLINSELLFGLGLV